MKKILIVDDEENIRLLYREELSLAGYETITAETGKEALTKFQEEEPDLVTIDIKMPDMDGIELLRKIREINKRVPIVMVTAYGDYKQDFNVWASNAYITKSHDTVELIDTVRNILAQNN